MVAASFLHLEDVQCNLKPICFSSLAPSSAMDNNTKRDQEWKRAGYGHHTTKLRILHVEVLVACIEKKPVSLEFHRLCSAIQQPKPKTCGKTLRTQLILNLSKSNRLCYQAKPVPQPRSRGKHLSIPSISSTYQHYQQPIPNI